jgi:hypothetical protein
MAYELTLALDPAGMTGLAVSAKLFNSGSLVMTVSLSESPAGSAVYSNPSNISGLASGVYAVQFINTASGGGLGTGRLDWNGSTENLPLTNGSTFDTVTMVSLFELLVAAFVTGKATVTDNGDGTSTIVRYKQDGVTTKYSVTFNRTTGAIAAASILH